MPNLQCHNATFAGGTSGILFATSGSIPMMKLKNPYESTTYVRDAEIPTMPHSHRQDLKSVAKSRFKSLVSCSLPFAISKPLLGNHRKGSLCYDICQPSPNYYLKMDSDARGIRDPKKCGTEVAFSCDFYPWSLQRLRGEILSRHHRRHLKRYLKKPSKETPKETIY
jgi:hypothetical protein